MVKQTGELTEVKLLLWVRLGVAGKQTCAFSVAVLPSCLKPYMKLFKRRSILAEENQVPSFHLITRKAGVKLGFLVVCISC